MTTEKKKFDGSVVRVAECLVGDASGCAILVVRNGKLTRAIDDGYRAIRSCEGRSNHLCIECFG